jgi:X-X-X-Leu-X-X-Gly heptad repeat protein
VPLDAVAARLFAVADQLGVDAMQALARSFPAVAAYDAVRVTRTREDLVYIVQFIAASLASGDDTVFFEFLTWLQQLLAGRGVPAQALVAGLNALRPGVGQLDDGAQRLLDTGRELLVSKGPARAASR